MNSKERNVQLGLPADEADPQTIAAQQQAFLASVIAERGLTADSFETFLAMIAALPSEVLEVAGLETEQARQEMAMNWQTLMFFVGMFDALIEYRIERVKREGFAFGQTPTGNEIQEILRRRGLISDENASDDSGQQPGPMEPEHLTDNYMIRWWQSDLGLPKHERRVCLAILPTEGENRETIFTSWVRSHMGRYVQTAPSETAPGQYLWLGTPAPSFMAYVESNRIPFDQENPLGFDRYADLVPVDGPEE